MFFQPFNGYHSWPWYCLLVALLFGPSEASVAVTGVHTGYNGTARPSRRNILDLYSDPDQSQWSLFIQALAAFQKAPESSDLSYYGICGIHGRPYTSWDGVSQGSGSPLTGYCTHDSVLFPTWHRPYLALYEQQLATYAQSIAQNYTPTLLPTYRNAADVLRIPYWDWAANATVPDCVNAATVSIIAPDGSTQQVSNPLQQYNFQTFPLNPNYFPTSSSRAGDWFLANYRNTVRSPDTNGGASDYAAVNTAMNNQGLKAATWNTFTKAKTFNGMATMIVGSNSIEGYHGNVHVVVGGNYGHMTYLSYAAFDPIFWLHHTNVDRIFALWEAIYPTTTMTPITEQYGTFAIPRGQTNTASSPLPPFSSSSTQNFYTSTGSMQMSTFGYTYPEINDWSQSQSQLQSNVTAQVTSLYGNGQTFKKRASTDQHSTHAHHSHIKRADTGIALNQYREWSIEISVQKYAIQGQSFKITCFLGSVPTNPVDWLTSSNVVGSLAVLPNKAYASPTDGVSYPNSTVMHEISLQEGLARIAGFEVDDDVGIVGEYLKGNLKWVVQLVDGTPVESCDSLDIMVVDEIVTMPDTLYELPSYGKKTLHPEITGGQLGGYGYMKRRKFV